MLPIFGDFCGDFAPPAPPQKSGFHCYHFMLFEHEADTAVMLIAQQCLHNAVEHCRVIYHTLTMINTTATFASAINGHAIKTPGQSLQHDLGFTNLKRLLCLFFLALTSKLIE